MSSSRLIVVLGHSSRSGRGLDEICAARVRRAKQVARAEDAVLLSGWARRGRVSSEAEQMAHAWSGAPGRIVLDGRARSTLGNVRGAAALAEALGAGEVVLVTSSWHSRRAATLLRWALRGSGATIGVAASAERGSIGALLREVACWTLVPFGVVSLAVSSRRRRARLMPRAGATASTR